MARASLDALIARASGTGTRKGKVTSAQLAAHNASTTAALLTAYAASKGTGAPVSFTDTGSSGGGGHSVWGAIKSLGGDALNVLSLPSAAVVTGAAKIGHAAFGTKDVSWKNLEGTFRKNYIGGAGLLDAYGVKNANIKRWAGLGIDIGADPLWLTGAGALTSISKLGKVGLAGERAAVAEKSLKYRALAAKRGAKYTARQRSPEAFIPVETPGGVVNMIHPAAQAANIRDVGKHALLLEKSKAVGYTPALRFGLGKKLVVTSKGPIEVKRGVQIPLWYKPIGAKDLKNLKDTKFRLSPMGRVAAVTRNAARGAAAQEAIDLQKIADGLHLTPLDRRNITLVAGGKNADNAAGLERRRLLIRAGQWGPNHDKMLAVLERRNVLQGKALGYTQDPVQGAHVLGLLTHADQAIAKVHTAAAAEQEAVKAAHVQAVVAKTTEMRASLAKIDSVAQGAKQAATVVAADRANAADVLARLEQRYAAMDPIAGRDAAQHGAKGHTLARLRAARAELRPQLLAARKEVKALDAKIADLGAQVTTAGEGKLKILDAFRADQATFAETTQKQLAQVAAKGESAAQTAADEAAAAIRAEAASLGFGRVLGGKRKMSQFKGYWPKGSLKAPKTLDELRQRASLLESRGTYFPTNASTETMTLYGQHVLDELSKLGTATVPDHLVGSQTRPLKPLRPRTRGDDPVSQVTRERFVKETEALGASPAEAQAIARAMGDNFTWKVTDMHFVGPDKKAINVLYTPELDIVKNATLRGESQPQHILTQQMEALLREVGYTGKGVAEATWKDLNAVVRSKHMGSSASKVFGITKDGRNRIDVITAHLKQWYTNMNPGHYMTNLWGDFSNDMVMGNYRHLMKGLYGGVPGTKVRQLAQHGISGGAASHGLREADPAVLTETFKMGKHGTMTGGEILAGARMSGLPLGFTGAEVSEFLDITSKARLTAIPHMMSRWNLDRENASRMYTWMNHVRGGDDMLAAAIKTTATKFDYAAATQFEKIWMRNMFLFYTWFRKNLELHGRGLVARPGLYSTLNHIEANRQKLPNEPGWWSQAFGLGTPVGLLTWSSPLGSFVQQTDVSASGFRRTALSSLTPFLKVPIEAMTGVDTFTGAPLKQFAGQNVPTWYASLAAKAGVPTASSRQRAGEASPRPAVPWWVAYAVKQLQGPQGGIMQSISQPSEGLPALTALSRFAGIRLNPNQPEQWAAAAAAKARREKMDAAKKRKMETP